MDKKDLAVVLGSTANMTFALASVLLDLKKHLNCDFDLIIYHKDIEQSEQNLLNSIIPAKFIEYNFADKNTREKSLNRYTLLMFSRYECFDLLDGYKKVLWLDIDVIIQKDLTEFIKTKTNGLALWQNFEHKNSFNFVNPPEKYNHDDYYFNSGVILFEDNLPNRQNLKNWCYDKTIEWGENLVCPDQAVLNMMFEEFNINVSKLDEIYNCHPERPVIKDAVIVHSYAEEKCWNYYNFKQWQENYNNWLKMGGSPYKGTKANLLDKAFIKFKKKYMPSAPDPKRHTGKFIKYIYEHNFKKAKYENACKVSIITVTYNADKTLEDSIKSVLCQTYKNIEYILIDGGSKDKTNEIIDKYRDKISYFISEPDNGIFNAMNKGIKASTGDVLYFLNANDYLFDEEVIKNVVNFFKRTKSQIVFGDMSFIEDNGTEKERRIYSDVDKLFFINECVCHQGIFYKQEVFEKCGLYDESLKLTADYDLNVNAIVSKNLKAGYFPRTIAKFTLGGQSNSENEGLKKLAENEKQKIINTYYSPYQFKLNKILNKTFRSIARNPKLRRISGKIFGFSL